MGQTKNMAPALQVAVMKKCMQRPAVVDTGIGLLKREKGYLITNLSDCVQSQAIP